MLGDPVFPIYRVDAGDCWNCREPLDPATSWVVTAPDLTALYVCSFDCLEQANETLGREP